MNKRYEQTFHEKDMKMHTHEKIHNFISHQGSVYLNQNVGKYLPNGMTKIKK